MKIKLVLTFRLPHKLTFNYLLKKFYIYFHSIERTHKWNLLNSVDIYIWGSHYILKVKLLFDFLLFSQESSLKELKEAFRKKAEVFPTFHKNFPLKTSNSKHFSEIVCGQKLAFLLHTSCVNFVTLLKIKFRKIPQIDTKKVLENLCSN